MAVGEVDAELGARLDELRKNRDDTVRISEVADVVHSLMATLKGDLSTSDLQIYNELEALATYIETAKREIAALRPDEVRDEYIPTAADELDAIVEATAEATNAIMDATESVEKVMAHLAQEDSEALMDATTRIYEACGFQDITGQRITKVVRALKHIEQKIDALVEAFGQEIEKVKAANPANPAEAEPPPITDADLLHGPQLKTDAKSQAEIDALFASFD
ncbi:MAG: protein phosphatase CheZ [Magnetospirillum sp. WYHS-4]